MLERMTSKKYTCRLAIYNGCGLGTYMQWAVGSNVTNLYSTWRNLSGVRAGTELLPPGLIADPVGVVGCDDIELASNELSGGFCSAVSSSVECTSPMFAVSSRRS